jgi:RAB protein geranylgeranyltransferase component A
LRVVAVYGQPEDFPYTVTCPEGRYLKYVVSVKESPDAERNPSLQGRVK